MMNKKEINRITRLIDRTNNSCWETVSYIGELFNAINDLDKDSKGEAMKQIAKRYKEINKRYDQLKTLGENGRDFDEYDNFIDEFEELLEQIE